MASEAKQSIPPHEERMDCFVASAPRNDVDGDALLTAVIPAHAGIQYAAASRFYHHRLWNTGSPGQAGDDTGYVAAFSRRIASEVCSYFRDLSKQRAQGRPGARCTRGLVCKLHIKNAHEHTGSAEAVRPSLRNGFTAYTVLSPATGSLATVIPEKR